MHNSRNSDEWSMVNGLFTENTFMAKSEPSGKPTPLTQVIK